MKILYITTVGGTMMFFKDLIKDIILDNHKVDIMSNETIGEVPDCYKDWNCKVYHHSCSRSPLSFGNLKGIKQIKELVESNNYDIVHCHTPIAALCTRLACRKQRKKGLRVIYTAHGFHFYKGAPVINWLIYYPIEKICSYFTDVLITINTEDYELAKKKMKAKRVEYVPGVGIDVDKFRNTVVDKNEKRKEIGIPKDAFLLLSAGELNKNKNHEIVIKALAEINNPNIHYAIAGRGPLHDYLINLSKELDISNQVHLLGYRMDIAELYKCADIYILPSIREGLNVSVMEALASEVPVICSKIRGNVDMIQDSQFLFDANDLYSCVDTVKFCLNNVQKIECMESNKFREKEINKNIKDIYFLI